MRGSNQAKRLLTHYIRLAFEAGGLTWDMDNQAEVEEIIDEIIFQVKGELLEEVTKMLNAKSQNNGTNANQVQAGP